MREVIVRDHYVGGKKLEPYRAKFHQFGVDYEEFESGAVNYSTAIVEGLAGVITNPPIQCVRFLSDGELLLMKPVTISGSIISMENIHDAVFDREENKVYSKIG